jgi:putative transposase
MEAPQKPGWHDRGYLPHFDANTLLQHVVFRTVGALPKHVVEQAKLAPQGLQRSLIDDALDNSQDGSVFSDHDCADIMQKALRHFDGDRYDLQAWCVMPNHVHVVLVTDPQVLLGRIVKSWKHAVAWRINKLQGTERPIFAKDYFDRFVRNLKQADSAIGYVEANPVKTGLVEDAASYRWSSAYFRMQGWLPRHDRLLLFLD